MFHKSITLENCSIKSEGKVIKGYASTFNNVDSYKDTVLPGAFLHVNPNDVRVYYNHKYYYNEGPAVIGKLSKHQEDDKGLLVELELTSGHTLASNVLASVEHKTITGLSIGYELPANGAFVKEGIRYLTKVDLREISIVDDPADDFARINNTKFKLQIESAMTLADFEEIMRDAGFSKSQATTFISQFKKAYRDDYARELQIKYELNNLLSQFR
jgi:HK97 family phage prohead protease